MLLKRRIKNYEMTTGCGAMKAKGNLIYDLGLLWVVMLSLCGDVFMCTFGSKPKRNIGTCPLSVFTVAMWLDDPQTMRFLCACYWHAGQQGAAWQCLTLKSFRAGDKHHAAQLTTEADGCESYVNVVKNLVMLDSLKRLFKSLESTRSVTIKEMQTYLHGQKRQRPPTWGDTAVNYEKYPLALHFKVVTSEESV